MTTLRRRQFQRCNHLNSPQPSLLSHRKQQTLLLQVLPCFLFASFFSFLVFSLFLYFLFTSVLSLLLHLRIVLARCRPGCMQRTLSHVISPTCELAFFCAVLLLVACGVVFCQQYFWCHTTFRFFLYLIQIPFSFFVTVWLHNTYDHISKTAVQ